MPRAALKKQTTRARRERHRERQTRKASRPATASAPRKSHAPATATEGLHEGDAGQASEIELYIPMAALAIASSEAGEGGKTGEIGEAKSGDKADQGDEADEAILHIPSHVILNTLRDDCAPADGTRSELATLQTYAAGLYDEGGQPPASVRKSDRDALQRIMQGQEHSGNNMTPPVPTLMRDAQAIGDALAEQADSTASAGVLEDIQMYDRNESRQSLAIEKRLYKLAGSKLVVRMDEAGRDGLRQDERESFSLHENVLTPYYRHYLETVRECTPGVADDGRDLDVYENAGSALPSVEEVTRVYCFDYYRPPIAELGERPCAAGHQCRAIPMARLWKARHPAERQLVPPEVPMREFYLQREMTALKRRVVSGEAPAEVYASMGRRLCLFCLRSATNDASDEIASDVDRTIYSKATAEAAHLAPVRIVQNHCYVFDREGEYSSQKCMLLCGQNFQGIIKPFLQFNFRFYTPVAHSVPTHNGQQRTRVVGWADDPSVIYHYATDAHEGYGSYSHFPRA